MADETTSETRPSFVIGVPAPTYVLLHHFGALINQAYDTVPYMVGSATRQKTGWRDVDVRLILDDDQFDAMFGPPPMAGINPLFSLLCSAISMFGERMTGLPIDFQFQQRTWANKRYDGFRQPLGIWVTPEPAASSVDGGPGK